MSQYGQFGVVLIRTRRTFQNGVFRSVKTYKGTVAEVEAFEAQLVLEGLNYAETENNGVTMEIEVTFPDAQDGATVDTDVPENNLRIVWSLDEEDVSVSIRESTTWQSLTDAQQAALGTYLDNPTGGAQANPGGTAQQDVDYDSFADLIKLGINTRYSTRHVLTRSAIAPSGWSGSFSTADSGKVYASKSALDAGENVPDDLLFSLPSAGVYLKTGLRARQDRNGAWNLESRFIHFDSVASVLYDVIT